LLLLLRQLWGCLSTQQQSEQGWSTMRLLVLQQQQEQQLAPRCYQAQSRQGQHQQDLFQRQAVLQQSSSVLRTPAVQGVRQQQAAAAALAALGTPQQQVYRLAAHMQQQRQQQEEELHLVLLATAEMQKDAVRVLLLVVPLLLGMLPGVAVSTAATIGRSHREW
jgi:hypothetical protein